MRINEGSLRGYILEEVLAFLIQKTGYKLLVDPSQDTRDLDYRGNGLVVKGRGSVHQVDVLGQLEWVPAFTFPLRLFIEAKFRKKKTGIDTIRNAIGIVLDINQNNTPTRENGMFLQRYHYSYALFSTSGYSGYAVNMALAHQISLIDLSGDDFKDLRQAIHQTSRMIKHNIEKNYPLLEEIPSDEEASEQNVETPEQIDVNKGKIVSEIRNILRTELATMPPEIIQKQEINNHNRNNDEIIDRQIFGRVIDIARQYRELFVAMANGPFILVLKADNPDDFIRYAINHPRHKVRITWSEDFDEGHTWIIRPSDNQYGTYRLVFKLPEILKDWIFETSDNARSRALHAKQQLLSNITIYRVHHGNDQLIRLEYDPADTRRYTSGINF